MSIKNFTIYLLIFCSFPSLAQIEGTIIDSQSEERIADVEILEIKSGESTRSDTEGYFKLELNNSKIAELIFYKDGYQIKEATLDSFETYYNFVLEKLQVKLSEIELIRKRKEIFATRKLKDIEGTSIYAGKKSEVIVLDLINANTAANISREIYAQISGLNIYEGSDGGLQLNIGGRGLDPNRTSNFNTRQNGYDISADVLGYPENYYTPPTDALDEIRILRGASSLQYGTQFGGLIDFRIRKIDRFRRWDIRSKQTYGSFNFYNSFNSIAYNGKKWAIDAFYNYKDGDGYRNNSAFKAHNFFIASRYYFSDKTKVEFEFTYFNYLAKQAGGLTDLQFEQTPRLSTRDRNWFAVDWKLYNVKLNHSFTQNSQIELSLFALDAQRKSVGYRGNPISLNENPITSIDEQDNAGNYLNPRDLIFGEFKNVGAELRYLNKYKLNALQGTYLIGAKYYNSNNSSMQGPGSTGTDADFNFFNTAFSDYANQSDFLFPNLNFAAFVENIFYVKEKLSVTPGLRFEYINTQSDGNYKQLVFDLAGNPIANNEFEESKNLSRKFLLAGIGIDYTISEKLKYSINLSQNYRSVTFSDIRVVNPGFIVDENISDENGYSFNMGVTGIIKSKFSYDFNFFSLLYNDRIGIILDNRANRVRTNIGDALISGVESLVNYIPLTVVNADQKIFQLKTFVNASYTYSRYLDALSNNVTGNTVEFIPTLNIKTGLSCIYKNFSVSLQHSYLSSQFTDAQNSLAAVNGDFRSGIIGEIPAYHIFDLSAQFAWKKFNLSTGVNNLSNETYFTRRATGYPGPGIIPSDGRSFYVTLAYIFQQ